MVIFPIDNDTYPDLDQVVREDNMHNGAKDEGLVDGLSNNDPIELDNQLFSYESPDNSSYPTISFPVCVYYFHNYFGFLVL